MSVLFSFSLYFLSFTPLWLSIAFVDVMSIVEGSPNVCTEYLSLLSIVIGFLFCTVILAASLNSKNRDDTQNYFLTEVKEDKTITAEFLLSYILPLFAFDFTLWQQVVLFLVFFITLGLLCIRHNYFCVNIVLELAGYRFYHCLLTNEDGIRINKTVLCKKHLNTLINESLKLRTINNDISLYIS